MLYFNWLQKNNPTGIPDRFPALKNRYETSVPGLYCIGDLTGIPLITFAAESGYEIIEQLSKDEAFKNERRSAATELFDLIIIGAGPSGVAASLHASDLGYRHLLLESTRMFNTIANFPANKPIYVTGKDGPVKSALTFNDGSKETLLGDLAQSIAGKPIPIRDNEMVARIVQGSGSFTVETTRGSYRALRVIVAIGKTGNSRRLQVAGDMLPKVFMRLIDPGEFRDKDILVVGGGDSAVEAAIALADAGNRVTLSYRKSMLARPKEHTLTRFKDLVDKGAIVTLFESKVLAIRDKEVVITDGKGERTITNDAVFTLIGSEIPIEFFKRSGIRMEGEKRIIDWLEIAAMLLFASVLYFGKKAPGLAVHDLTGFLSIPAKLAGFSWPNMVCGLFAWGSFIGLALCILFIAGNSFKDTSRYFTSAWNSFKYSYYLVMMLFFPFLYVTYKLLQQRFLFGDMGDWYTVLYSLTIVIFGFRRIAVNPTGYIRRQTFTLMSIQVVLLCLLPMFVIPFLGTHGVLGDWVMENVFPNGSYWRAYGLVLAWPLFIHNLATGQPTFFWLLLGLLQTFVIIPSIVYRWGKGAYCGWICSCGALAETLGDEYRTKAPHGPLAKKLDNAGQVVLWFAVVVTLLALIANQKGSIAADFTVDLYRVIVDIVFAGVLGLGVYSFLSGRFWCRVLCPLAALMHIYARFSVYRIFSNKKRCISCSICTKVCHMGIDVMNYANKGIPMNDVECVRCSACVVSCPMQVLTFGRLKTADVDNGTDKDDHQTVSQGWKSGLPG